MKTAIYIENETTQLVLTPETEWEKQVIRCIENGAQSVEIHRASFYECQGGWFRQGIGNESLILRTKIKTRDEHELEISLSVKGESQTPAE